MKRFVTCLFIAALLFIMPMFGESATYYKIRSSFDDPYGQIRIENTDGSFSIVTSLEKIPALLNYFHPEIKQCYDKNKGKRSVDFINEYHWMKWYLIYDILKVCMDEDTVYALLKIDNDNEKIYLSFWTYLDYCLDDIYSFSFNAAYTYFIDFYNGWYFGY